ncbi:MAG TPA: PHB depolymerase family esterase, partial [Polyangiaceae bacterium]|nr:PHB depolymerase family esterase [Polyangiaceae bacterium]
RADLNVITDESTGGSGPGHSNSGGNSGLGGNPSGSSAGRPGSTNTNQTASDCPSPALPVGDTSVTLQVGALSRSYVLHVPTTYSGEKPVPLLLDFHGVGSSGWGELSSSPYPAVTDREGVVIAFPDGLKGPAGTGWNIGPCCVADVDDVAFARAVVADVSRVACIDANRVYAAGVLTGGGMAHYLGCHAADEFAAVAPAAFDLLDENVNDCRPVRPVTVISFRGTAVSRVPYEGGESSLVPNMPITFLGAKATFEQWAKINGCTGEPSLEDGDGCSSYSGCPADVEVILCTKPDGREEPGDANLAWPVLRRHSR